MAAFCGALAAGAVMEIPWNPRRSTLRCGQCRPCGLDCCVAKTRHHCGCYFAQRLAVPRDARCSWAARFLPITLGSFPWSEPHRRLKRSGSRRKKARRGHLRALGFRPGRHARQALHRSALADRQHVAALAKEHPGSGQRHTGQGRQPAVADDGGKLRAEHGKTVRCGKIILWVV